MGCRTRSSQNPGSAWVGGVWPLPGFLWRICPHALRALKGDHSLPKSDNFPTKVFLFPQKPLLFNIFTLKNDLCTFVKKCRMLSSSIWLFFSHDTNIHLNETAPMMMPGSTFLLGPFPGHIYHQSQHRLNNRKKTTYIAWSITLHHYLLLYIHSSN